MLFAFSTPKRLTQNQPQPKLEPPGTWSAQLIHSPAAHCWPTDLKKKVFWELLDIYIYKNDRTWDVAKSMHVYVSSKQTIHTCHISFENNHTHTIIYIFIDLKNTYDVSKIQLYRYMYIKKNIYSTCCKFETYSKYKQYIMPVQIYVYIRLNFENMKNICTCN